MVATGTIRIVRGDLHVARLRQRGDLAQLGDPTRVADVGLGHVHQSAGQDRPVIPLREQPLAGRQPNGQSRRGDFRQRVGRIRRHWLFEKQQPERRQRPAQLDGVARRKLPVVVEHDVDVVADRLPHGLDPRDGRPQQRPFTTRRGAARVRPASAP